MTTKKKPENKKPTYFRGGYPIIDFTPARIRYLKSMVLNGLSLDQIGDYFGTTEKGLLANLSKTGNERVKEAFRNAIAEVTAKAEISLEKMAEGYTYFEREYKKSTKPMAKEWFDENIDKLKTAVIAENFELFWSLVIQSMLSEEDFDVKVYEKFEKPDFRAAQKILDARSGNIWDLDAKHKSIPQTKIVVTVVGEPKRKKEIPADVVIEK